MTISPFLKRIPDVEAVHVQRSLLCRTVDAILCSAESHHWFADTYTRFVSRDASLSTGIMIRKKKIDNIAKPLAARAYETLC